MAPRGSEDSGNSSNSGLGSPESLGEIDSELLKFCAFGISRCTPLHSYRSSIVSRYRGVTAVGPEMVPIHAQIFLRSRGVDRDIRGYREPLAVANIGEEDVPIRRAAFVAYWLSKCVFGEYPAYSIKPLYFPLVVKIAAGACFPLAPLLLGQIYTQLDLLHAEELIEVSCHIITTAFNSSIVHTFLWEHALEYIRKGRKPYEARNKFASMPEVVAAHVGDFQGDVPAVYRWSVMSGFRNVEAQDYTLIAEDMRSLTYLSATNTGWLLVLSSSRLQFTAYSTHKVRRQFGFDQEVPTVMGIAASEIPAINPFLKARAFAYWSGIASRVIVPSGDRVGVYTTGMVNYWRELMAAMVEFRNNGRGDISHLLQLCIPLLPHPRLFEATNTMTTYPNRQHHPHIPAPEKVPSSRGRRTAPVGTPAAKERQSSKSKKREAPSKDSPAQASKKKKTSATKGSREVIVLKTAFQNTSPAGESAVQGVSAPVSKKLIRKTRAGKRTFVPPAFPNVPTSIAARVAARKSIRSVVYSERRSKQRADTFSRVPIVIPDNLDSSSSSTDSSDPSGAATERIESEDVEIDAAETVSGAEAVAAEINSANESTASSVSSWRRGFDGRDHNLRPVERAVDEHTTAGVVTSAARAVKTTPITIISSATVRVPTPPSPLHESGGTAPTPVVITAVVPAAVTVQDSEAVPAAAEEVPGIEEISAHIPDILKGNNIVESIPIDESLVVDTDFGTGVTHVEYVEVAASEDPVQADVIPDSDVQAMEETFVQDPADDISMEDMTDTHDSYDAVLAETEDYVAGTQAADMEVTALVTAHTNPTKIAGSSNEAVAEEERRHQIAGVESAIRGQPGLLSAARSATLGSSVLADMDAFFREFDRMSALWEKYGNCSSYFRLGVHVRSSMLTLLCCMLAHMEHTRLEDITEVHILEWKAVVQEVIEGSFKFSFILDYLQRLAYDIFSRRILAELRVVEACAVALRDALNMVAPNPWDLASARGVSAEPHAESALYGLLA
uniref:Aminotransferase-like plant mobile domain-containing protein n=1 Tax=Fagus sylvatica TaxID=28930 RepID=A0A2N9EY06_FAGSY